MVNVYKNASPMDPSCAIHHFKETQRNFQKKRSDVIPESKQFFHQDSIHHGIIEFTHT